MGPRWSSICSAGACWHHVVSKRLVAEILLHGHSAPAFHLCAGLCPPGPCDVPNGRGQLWRAAFPPATSKVRDPRKQCGPGEARSLLLNGRADFSCGSCCCAVCRIRKDQGAVKLKGTGRKQVGKRNQTFLLPSICLVSLSQAITSFLSSASQGDLGQQRDWNQNSLPGWPSRKMGSQSEV